ncbi:MAG: Crp/Fnr family transcriptional regulator [Bdellovibrionia bacterium]
MSEKKDCQPSHKTCATCGNKLDNIICSSGPDVVEILERSKVMTKYKPGQTIFYAGNDPLGLYTVSRGLVKLETVSATGAAHTLRLVGSGGTLGYRSLFSNEPYHASAVAIEDTEICFIPRSDIMTIFAGHPEIAMKLLNHLSKDLRQAEMKWMDQMDKGAGERVAEALLFLQEHFQHQEWTRREIAQWAGTTPETVIRTLAQFEREGIIDQTEGRLIHIKNRDKLKERSQAG